MPALPRMCPASKNSKLDVRLAGPREAFALQAQSLPQRARLPDLRELVGLAVGEKQVRRRRAVAAIVAVGRRRGRGAAP